MTISARLTSWYTVVLFAVLVVLGDGLYVADSRLRLAQLDGELARGCDAVASVVGKEMEEEGDLRSAAREAAQDFPTSGRVFAIYDAAGAALTGMPETALGQISMAEAGWAAGASRSVPTPHGKWRVHVHGYQHGGRGFSVVAASNGRKCKLFLSAPSSSRPRNAPDNVIAPRLRPRGAPV